MKIGEIEFGEAWRPDKKSLTVVVPLIRKETSERNYVTFEEVKDKADIEDTGSINNTKINLSHDKPVFLRTGTIFKGQGTQTRAVNTSIVIMPQKQAIEVPVSCVHASHAINRGSKFAAMGSAPSSVTSQLFAGRSQGAVWGSVKSYSCRAQSAGGQSASRDSRVYRANMSQESDNLVENMEGVGDFSEKIDEIVSKMPRSENQVGVMILNIEGVVGMEMFDSPKSWDAVSVSTIKKYGEDLVKKQEKPLFELNEKEIKPKIEAHLKRLHELTGKMIHRDGNSETRVHEDKEIVVEWTTIDNKLIHIISARRDEVSERTSCPHELSGLRGLRAYSGPSSLRAYSVRQ